MLRTIAQPIRSDGSILLYLETKLKEFPVEEKEVLKILTQVNVTRRECEIVRLPIYCYVL